MTSRVRPQNLHTLNSATFGTMHATKCSEPIVDVLAFEELFLDVRSNLRPGDTVSISRLSDGDVMKARVLEHCTVLITQKAADLIEFRLIGEILYVDAAKPEPVAAPEEPASLEVAPDPNGGFVARRVTDGQVEKHFKSKAAAERYVTDYGPKQAA